MGKKIVLSESDHEEIRLLLQWFRANQNLRHRFRRRNIPPSSGSRTFARIVQGLRRADEAAGVTALDYYQIELLNNPIAAWSSANVGYYEDDKVKYESKIYECTVAHTSSSAILPTNTTYWTETTYTMAWVFGYAGDLLGTVPWFQPNDIVEVLKYTDARFADRVWWILETVTDAEYTDAEGLHCSLSWSDEQKRAMAVYV